MDVHAQTLAALKEKVEAKSTRDEIIYLMTEAKKTYSAIAEPDATAIPRMLEIGKKKRG